MKFFGAIEKLLNPGPFLGAGWAMGNISVTAGNVAPGAGFTWRDGYAGEALTQGQVVFIDANNANKFYKASTASAAASRVVGVVLDAASAGQHCRIQTGGVITIGGTTAIGVAYSTSDTAGLIALASDNATGDYACSIGIGVSTTQILLGFNYAGAAMA